MININDLNKNINIKLSSNCLYFKKKGNQLESISFSKFARLEQQEKEEVLNILEHAIQVGIPNDEVRHKIQRIRNVIFSTLQDPPPVEIVKQVPKDVWKQTLSHTSPKTVAECRSISKKFQDLSGKEQILSINRGLKLFDVCPQPPKIQTASQVLDWLEKTGHSHLLEYADFNSYENDKDDREGICFVPSLKEEDLTRLFTLCPNLKFLSIQDSYVKSLPELPKSLQELDCSHCNLKELPELPKTLRKLDCSYNSSLSHLPEDLPVTLLQLDCSSCDELARLPNKLPVKLQVLCCGYTNIQKLPPLPPTLRVLECTECPELDCSIELPETLQMLYIRYSSGLRLQSDKLPKTLQRLSCHIACLNRVHKLPDTLRELRIQFDDSIPAILPKLPEALQFLHIFHGLRIESLPWELPPTLQRLKLCSLHSLKKLPKLPKTLKVLKCWDCRALESLPKLPDTLQKLVIAGCKALKTVPNLPSTLQKYDHSNTNLNFETRHPLDRYERAKEVGQIAKKLANQLKHDLGVEDSPWDDTIDPEETPMSDLKRDREDSESNGDEPPRFVRPKNETFFD